MTSSSARTTYKQTYRCRGSTQKYEAVHDEDINLIVQVHKSVNGLSVNGLSVNDILTRALVIISLHVLRKNHRSEVDFRKPILVTSTFSVTFFTRITG